jgi:hypothetical protein
MHQGGTARRTWEVQGGPGVALAGSRDEGGWPLGDCCYLAGARPQSLRLPTCLAMVARAAEPSLEPSGRLSTPIYSIYFFPFFCLRSSPFTHWKPYL